MPTPAGEQVLGILLKKPRKNRKIGTWNGSKQLGGGKKNKIINKIK